MHGNLCAEDDTDGVYALLCSDYQHPVVLIEDSVVMRNELLTVSHYPGYHHLVLEVIIDYLLDGFADNGRIGHRTMHTACGIFRSVALSLYLAGFLIHVNLEHRLENNQKRKDAKHTHRISHGVCRSES